MRDLRNQNRDVFQVIYTQAVRVEWHHFWFKHLVPQLKDLRDTEGMTTHVHRVSQWKNDDPAGVIAFWAEVLDLAWIDKIQIARQLEFSVSDIHETHSALLAPLLVTLCNLPQQSHSSLGRALARCAQAGGLDDAVLWRYVAGEVNDEDVPAFHMGNKLRCQPHEFGDSNDSFFLNRMRDSIALLEFAAASIERWSEIKRSAFGDRPMSYWSGFLHETSYNDEHSQNDHRHLDSERILLDAVEAAIVHHARNRSNWWQGNRERLCFSTEGSLRYFAILACTADPVDNLGVIARMLVDKPSLESDLSYELGTLMQAAFVHLDPVTQDAVQVTILDLHRETSSEPIYKAWVLERQAELIVAIPCHLRSFALQVVLNECEKVAWPLVREPIIRTRGGTVRAPFSFEVFLAASDSALLRLLAYYDGYDRNSFDELLVGGEREVGWQLREAASRNPTRFLELLQAKWVSIPDRFCDDIMDGVASYLAYRYGNLQANNSWSPIEEPDAATLAQQVLDELERHPNYWSRNRAASNALRSCAHVVPNTTEAERLVFLAVNFATIREDSSVSGDTVSLITTGINMARGHVVEALMILANQLQKIDATWPELLTPALRQFAADQHPAIRALMLRRLPHLQRLQPELGWALFDIAIQEEATGLWAEAEACLYYSYYHHFEIVGPRLARLFHEGHGKDLQTWGRISALAALSEQIDFPTFLTELISRKDAEEWSGAASVWTHAGNAQEHYEQCMTGLAKGLNADNPCAAAVARKFSSLFRNTTILVPIPTALIERFFALLEIEDDSARRDYFGFDAWLNASARRDPMTALAATETYLKFIRRTKPYLYDHDNNLTQLLTHLFAEAEEQEESDDGTMLQRVVAVQDTLLAIGVNGVNDWLKAAERT
jgi:hypothetical protein